MYHPIAPGALGDCPIRQGASQAMLHAVGMTPEDLNKAQAGEVRGERSW